MITEKIVIVRACHLWWKDSVFVLCSGTHYWLWTPWKKFLVQRGNTGRQESILKSAATISSPISGCNFASFLCLFICFSARKPARGSFYPDCVHSVFPHATQITKAPSSRYIRAFKLRVHRLSPLEQKSEVWHNSLQVLYWTSKKQCPASYCGTRQGAWD